MINLEEPDKGYAWVVAFSSFGINFVCSGIYRSMGIIYIQVLNYYKLKRREATIPFSVMSSVRCLSGPFIGMLGQRYGIQAITFWGGLMAAVGVALCRAATDIIWMTVFWGLIYGLGFALCNTLFRVVVNEWFDRYRSTASGVALSGACVGSLLFPFFLDSVLEHYDLPGLFLFLSGVILHVVPLSLLLKSPLWEEDPERYEKLSALIDSDRALPPLKSATKRVQPTLQAKAIFSNVATLATIPIEDLQLLTFARKDPLKRKVKSLEIASLNENEDNNIHKKYFSIPVALDMQDMKNMSSASRIEMLDNLSKARTITGTTISTAAFEIPGTSSQRSETADLCPTPSEETSEIMSYKKSLKILVLLYKNPMFSIICIATTTYQMVYIIVLSILVDYGADKGIPAFYGMYMVNSMAVGDLCGRLCFGWITDKGYVSETTFMMFTYVAQSIILSLIPVMNSLFSYLVILFCLSMTLGITLVFFPVLLYQYVQHDIQSLAIGGAGFMAGIVTFCIPSLIGHFRDDIGSYDKMFFILGGIAFLTAICFFVTPLTIKYYYGVSFDEFCRKNA